METGASHRVREPTPIQDPLAADRRFHIVILAAGYTLTGIVGLSLAVPPGYVTAVWPPSGIALAAVLMWGPRVWPGIAAGSVLVNLAVAMTTAESGFSGASPVVAAAIAVGSTLQTLVCAAVIQRWIGLEQALESGPATLMFAGTVAAACLIASTWGTLSLSLAGLVSPEEIFASWQTWWLGDVIGMLVFAPVFLTWRQSLVVGHKPWRLAELAAAFTLLAATTAAVFLAPATADGFTRVLTFVPLPCLLWIAFRFRPNGVALGVCLLSLIAIAATANGKGPFGGALTTPSLLALQAFIGLTAVMALTIAAAVTGRRQSESALRNYSVEMEQLALTDELTGLRNRRGFLVLADQALRMARRSRTKCVLVFIDLDGLKRVNDTRGHAAGDALIADASRVLGRVFRESDVVGRVGGDEFAVFAILDEHDGSSAVSTRLQAEIDQFNAQAVPTMRVSMSIGIEEIHPASETPLDVLLSRADRAMYERKRRRA